MRIFRYALSVLLVGAAARPVLSQDSVSKTPCLPGDAVRPWSDANDPGGSEQCNDYVSDMDLFQTSWGNTLGITPLVKTSKASSGFFSSLYSAQGISRQQLTGVPYPRASYGAWNDAGFGVNNDPAINDAPGTTSPEGTSNQFGVVMSEFATTDMARNYNGVIGALVNYDPANPTRLYVSRVMAALNGCDNDSDLSQFGVGAVEEAGALHFRADAFGVTRGGCGQTILRGNNVFRVDLSRRNCDVRNVISDDYVAGGAFDKPATNWVLRNNAATHSVPNIVPASVTGREPLYIGPNFNGQYVRGFDHPAITSDTSHLGTGVINHRGAIAYTPRNCAALKSTHGVAGVLGYVEGNMARALNVFGLDGDGNVTGKVALMLPDDVFDNVPDPVLLANMRNIAGINEFDHYHGPTAFRGGVSQVGLGVDQQGNLIVAAIADHPLDGGSDWPLNYVAVARVNCETGQTEWTMAGYCDGTIGYEGEGGTAGKPVLDGDGNVIARMVSLDNITGGSPQGPSITAPMVDSVGNIYFVAALEFFADGGYFRTGLVRAVYRRDVFGYECELVLQNRQVFHGVNSNRDYQISFLGIASGTPGSISSGAAWSQNVSSVAHLGLDPGNLDPEDVRTLGGLVLAVEITYDYDQNGEFFDCGAGGPADQDYNVLLYIGATTPAEPGCVRDPDWVCDGDVDGNGAVNPVDYGLVQAAFCQSGECGEQALCQYDLDCNGVINPVDAGIVQSLFGTCDAPRPPCN